MVLTPDLAEAERFYSAVLGMALIEKTSNQLVYELAGSEFRVFEAAQACKHAASAATICIFEVASIDAEMSRMRKQGVVSPLMDILLGCDQLLANSSYALRGA